jgi:hypothetical protein
VQFVLVSKTPLVHASDLFTFSAALEQNVRDCSRDWGKTPAAVDVVDTVKGLPTGCNPAYFVDTAGPEGVLAEHYFDPLRAGPACRIYVTAGSGINQGQNSACEAASHELVEARVNPRLTLWAPYPGRPGVMVALETADPVQTHYTITVKGKAWLVSNYVTPAWFDATLLDEGKRRAFLAAGGKFDHNGELSYPGEIGPRGYAVTRKGDKAALLGPGGSRVELQEKHHHPLSRTKQLLERVS